MSSIECDTPHRRRATAWACAGVLSVLATVIFLNSRHNVAITNNRVDIGPFDSVTQAVGAICALPGWRFASRSEEECFREKICSARIAIVAARLQKMTDDQVAEILEIASDLRRMEKHENEIDVGARTYVLLRYIFDLPESSTTEEPTNFFGIDSMSLRKATQSHNWAWPLSWKTGSPRIVVTPEPLECRGRHRAAAEFRHLRARFPFRDLSSVLGSD
jgi:hypothetical protein